MNTKTGILLAGSLGLIIGLGVFGVRTFLKRKAKEYDDYYEDFHRHFVVKNKKEGNEGVEFLAVQ
ncbi:hypothetical protein FNJ88_07220 [Chryseobacterium sp. SNU WT5]|uniref:hypothetical protein n=1 Tax=Chryseobacterium sp. SNU WT5 TaxID=2594269 RepID=UPI00117F08E5|nr:hypothetical protein [Chryseobacterium sp. SNU WT5]QDP85362.1 hypothetical protein FNJ88_07220 [Chryseobacterium sp. SNU WT5]